MSMFVIIRFDKPRGTSCVRRRRCAYPIAFKTRTFYTKTTVSCQSVFSPCDLNNAGAADVDRRRRSSRDDTPAAK